MTQRTYSADYIKQMILTDARWTERALIALYNQQTASEQNARETNEHNGRGFTGADAWLLTDFAKQLLGIGSYTYNGRTYPRTQKRALTPAQLARARQKLGKYAKQLTRIANAS